MLELDHKIVVAEPELYDVVMPECFCRASMFYEYPWIPANYLRE